MSSILLIRPLFRAGILAGMLSCPFLAVAGPTVTTGHLDNDEASPAFKLEKLPAPAKGDAAESALFEVIKGSRDPNGGTASVLADGKLPTDSDEPGANFFFRAGTKGGQLRVDLTRTVEVRQINTYSWHPADRGPQVYTLYASDGAAANFKLAPESNPGEQGWQKIASVDTRTGGDAGGIYGASIGDGKEALGKFRYLLFDIAQTREGDPFANTFYSEIDVIAAGTEPAPITSTLNTTAAPFVIHAPDQACAISIHTTEAPELKEWAEKKLAPVLAEWYPRLTNIMASEGYKAPSRFSVEIKPVPGVAFTSGTKVVANSKWLKGELDGEAIGALLHEEVHVLQQYGRGRRNNPGSHSPPGWLVEGIPDYIRWFVYEPQSHGADVVWMSRLRNLDLRYNASYRTSANFLDYVSQNYDTNLVTKVNAACREHRDTAEVFRQASGKSLTELNDEWVKWATEQVAAIRAKK
jgi:hypothetical protein